MSRPLVTVGLVGAGWIAPVHLRAYRALGIEVRALLAPDRDQAAALCTAQGVAPRLHGGIDTFLDEDCDFFDVMVPPQAQPDLVARLVEGRRPLLCEKPLALGLTAAVELVRQAEAHGVILGVMHNQLFYGPHVRAREILAAGEIGEPRMLRLHLVGSHGARTPWKRGLQERGGMIWDDGIHRLYVAQNLFGPIERVHAHGRRDLAGAGAGWAGTVHLSFVDGRMGVLDFSYGLGGGEFYDDSLAVIGTRGVIEINGAFSRPWPMPAFAVRTNDTWREEPVTPDWEGSFAALVRHFIETAAAGRESPLIGGAAALQTVAVAEAIERSLLEERAVEIAEVTYSR